MPFPPPLPRSPSNYTAWNLVLLGPLTGMECWLTLPIMEGGQEESPENTCPGQYQLIERGIPDHMGWGRSSVRAVAVLSFIGLDFVDGVCPAGLQERPSQNTQASRILFNPIFAISTCDQYKITEILSSIPSLQTMTRHVSLQTCPLLVSMADLP